MGTGTVLSHTNGGAKEGRTPDLNAASVALYQLSYGPAYTWSIKACSRFGYMSCCIPGALRERRAFYWAPHGVSTKQPAIFVATAGYFQRGFLHLAAELLVFLFMQNIAGNLIEILPKPWKQILQQVNLEVMSMMVLIKYKLKLY